MAATGGSWKSGAFTMAGGGGERTLDHPARDFRSAIRMAKEEQGGGKRPRYFATDGQNMYVPVRRSDGQYEYLQTPLGGEGGRTVSQVPNGINWYGTSQMQSAMGLMDNSVTFSRGENGALRYSDSGGSFTFRPVMRGTLIPGGDNQMFSGDKSRIQGSQDQALEQRG